jgi:hypothetical protein
VYRALFIVVAAALAGCGGEDEQPAAPPAGDRDATRLEVVVRPEGPDGPARTSVVTELPRGIRPADFDPVPDDAVCTQIYGGPATARVTGVADGRRIDAHFSRSNGCEIARWDRLEPILGPAPGPRVPDP